MNVKFNIKDCTFSNAELLTILAEKLRIKEDWYLDNNQVCEDDYRSNPVPVINADKKAFDLYQAVKAKIHEIEEKESECKAKKFDNIIR